MRALNPRSVSLVWKFDERGLDWAELSALYRAAPLGDKKPADLETVFTNSLFKCFVYDDGELIAAGRALADGRDCSYICDVAVHPRYQGLGVGRAIIERLKTASQDHRKIILYAKPGKEGFYRKLGFLPMRTAMAIFQNQKDAVRVGLLADD